MAEWYAGKVSEYEEKGSKLIEAGEKRIGIYYIYGQFYAYENVCKHQGGPVCEGTIIGKVETVLSEDRQWIRDEFSEKDYHLVCPWHGYEYEITTGRCIGVKKLSLNRYEVVQKGDEIYVIVG